MKNNLPDELAWQAAYREAARLVSDIVDMPDRRLSILVRLLLQGKGQLPPGQRGYFSELTDPEVAAMELAVTQSIARRPGTATQTRTKSAPVLRLPGPPVSETLLEDRKDRF